MTASLTVGVSDVTVAELGTDLRPWLRLKAVGHGDPDLQVVWRRQTDRTAWLLATLNSCPSVGWVHTDTAGIDRLPLDLFAQRAITLSNAGGAHAVAVSEWAMGALILAAKRLDNVVRQSDSRDWAPMPANFELRGRSIFILGLGAIGSALAKLCQALGMRVVGVSRTIGPDRTYIDRHLCTRDDWDEELGKSSFLAICLPLTTATAGLVDRTVLGGLPEHAWVVNVGRGEIVDEQALVAAVTSGLLGGAVLDTVTHEPLDPDGALWGYPNIIVSPHASSFTERTSERTRALFLSEADRYRRGLAPVNTINLKRGY
jgi:phosphoglycerate dehydrogenase-like enzyme